MRFCLKKSVAALMAAALVSAVAAGCSGNSKGGDETSAPEEEFSFATARALEPGDKLAIKKMRGEIPEGYEVTLEVDNTIRYYNGYSIIEVAGVNYKEDYPALELYAEDISTRYAIMRKANLHEFDNFSDLTPVKVAGFDGYMYDYDVSVQIFVHVFDENGEPVIGENGYYVVEKDENGKDKKQTVATLKGQMYYFCSEKDIFSIYFETALENWDKFYPAFKEYLDGVTITE
jgi:hypothetical protein